MKSMFLKQIYEHLFAKDIWYDVCEKLKSQWI